MIEELRVSLFAQTLGTPAPVSEKRVLEAIAAAAGAEAPEDQLATTVGAAVSSSTGSWSRAWR